MKIKAIVAVDENWGIGKNQKIPWYCPTDFEFFKRITTGKGNNAVVMGRRTMESLPRFPLINRKNIVISATGKGDCDNLACIKDLKNFDIIWIIGGAQIYTEMLKTQIAEEIYISKIKGSFHCDVFFDKNLLEFSYTQIKSIKTEKDLLIEVWKHNSF